VRREPDALMPEYGRRELLILVAVLGAIGFVAVLVFL
jgi:hypothetical protein